MLPLRQPPQRRQEYRGNQRITKHPLIGRPAAANPAPISSAASMRGTRMFQNTVTLRGSIDTVPCGAAIICRISCTERE